MLIATAFSSCTKEDGVFDADDTGGIIELSDLPARSTSTVYAVASKSFDVLSSVEFPVTVKYSGTAGAPQDITIQMVIDTNVVNTYNSAEGTAYDHLKEDKYTVDSYTLTIPKGSKTATFMIRLQTNAFDFNLSYALGISIKSVSEGTLSGNYGTGIFRVAAKNDYEDDYTVTGWFFHPTAGRKIEQTKTLSTAGLTKCNAPVGDLGGYSFDFEISGTSLTNFVATESTPAGTKSGFFTADQPGASTWINSPVSDDKPGSAPWLHATYNNTYDASTQTFYMHYGYASGGTGEATWTRQIYEKWVRE